MQEKMLYLCKWPDCTFLTRWKTELEVHQLRHTGVKKVECEKCDKRFFCKRDLNIHQRIHTGFCFCFIQIQFIVII